MGIQADDLVRQIRSEAHAQLKRPHEGSASFSNGHSDLERLRAALAAARRAQDSLPPITSYRHGVIARVELWVKRRFKSATRWFTWEQANFNAATVNSFESTVKVLAELEQALLDLKSKVNDDSGLEIGDSAAITTRLSVLETNVQSLVEQIQAQSAEQARRIDLLIDEQRVCFKQLALQISEAAVVADRGKRNLQMQVDELARRLEDSGKKEETPIENR